MLWIAGAFVFLFGMAFGAWLCRWWDANRRTAATRHGGIEPVVAWPRTEPKPEPIEAVCIYCHKTDFKKNMEETVKVGTWILWYAHHECELKARGLMECPKCKGVGTVKINEKGEK